MRLLTLAAALIAGAAFAQISAPPNEFFEFLKIKGAPDKPVAYGKGYLQVATLDGLVFAVRYIGPKDSVEDAARVVAAAVGDEGAIPAFVSFVRENQAAIATRDGPVRVGFARLVYLMELEIDDRNLKLEITPMIYPDNAFGEPRHVLGTEGPLIREYSDFYCPHCQRLALEILPGIKRELVDRKRARFEYRHFPLVEIHPDAFQAAEASECAAEQGKFWPYHDELFATLARGEPPSYEGIAGKLGLNVDEFKACLEEHRYRKLIDDMLTEAERLGLDGTPSVFVGPFKLPDPFDLEAYKRYVRMAAALSKKGK